MAFIIQYPNDTRPIFVIGLSGSTPLTIPPVELQKIAVEDYDKSCQLISDYVPADRDILFVIHKNVCYTYNGSWATELGNGGCRITNSESVIFEIPSPKYPKLRRFVFLGALLAVIIIIVLINVYRYHHKDNVSYENELISNEENTIPTTASNLFDDEVYKDDNSIGNKNNEPDKIDLIDDGLYQKEETLVLRETITTEEIPGTSGPIVTAEIGNNDRRTRRMDSNDNPQSGSKADFLQCKEKGLDAYKEYFETGHDEKRIIAIQHFQEALEYKKDAEIIRYINELKKE